MMHPFLSNTRVSMTLCPTTSCLCSNGLRVSSSTSPQRRYLSSGFLTEARAAVRFRATCVVFREGALLAFFGTLFDARFADRFFIFRVPYTLPHPPRLSVL